MAHLLGLVDEGRAKQADKDWWSVDNLVKVSLSRRPPIPAPSYRIIAGEGYKEASEGREAVRIRPSGRVASTHAGHIRLYDRRRANYARSAAAAFEDAARTQTTGCRSRYVAGDIARHFDCDKEEC
jgi:hypothetical protein